MTGDDRGIPVILLTGFLGSGKTTLLRSLLECHDMRDTAVIINEFGEISLDHLIVGAVEGETVVLRNGCVCCALRDDLKQALGDLLTRAASGVIPRFRRAIVETTGLADPLPILQSLLSDSMLRHQFRHEQTIVTVDAVLGAGQLDRHAEAVRQTVVADWLVITKTDIATPAEIKAVKKAVGRINPGARLALRGTGGFDPLALLEASGQGAEARFRDAKEWLGAFEDEAAVERDHDHHLPDHHHRHDHGHGSAVRALSLKLFERLDWTAFGVWLSALLHRHSDRILRVKGILDVNDIDGPVILQAVQHLMHPPVHLPAWPDDERASKLVFIVEDLDPECIRRSLMAFLAAAARISGVDSVGAGAVPTALASPRILVLNT